MDKVRCIKECIMEDDSAVTTTVGKVYDLVDEPQLGDECFCIINDVGALHYFTNIGNGILTGDHEYFEGV